MGTSKKEKTDEIVVVAFDCDGVMFDSIAANIAYYNEILCHFNRPELTPEQHAYAHMHTSDNVLTYLFRDYAMLEAARAYQKQMGYRQFIRYMKMEPTLRPLLEWLNQRCKTAIATNRTYTMNWVLEEFGLDGYFDLVVSAKDVTRPKPDPEPLIKILNHFGVAPHQALFVGDSPVDEAAARAAGIPLVAFNNPSLEAAFHINRLEEIEKILTDSRTRSSRRSPGTAR